jgi:hypothetical protein
VQRRRTPLRKSLAPVLLSARRALRVTQLDDFAVCRQRERKLPRHSLDILGRATDENALGRVQISSLSQKKPLLLNTAQVLIPGCGEVADDVPATQQPALNIKAISSILSYTTAVTKLRIEAA